MKCGWQTYKILKEVPDDAVLLGYNDTVLCVVSADHTDTALQLLPPNLAVLGNKTELEDKVECVKECYKLLRVRGSVPMLVNKTTKTYLKSSIEHARQVLKSAVLISGNLIYSIDENTLPTSSDTFTTYQLASDLTSESGTAPVITREEDHYLTPLDIDVMLLGDAMSGGGSSPVSAVLSQFNNLIKNPDNKALHFQPRGLSVPITFLYSHQTEQRKQLHGAFCLPAVYYFNSSQAVRTDKQDSEGRFISPHKHVSNVRDGNVYTVSGDYAYHHYMQDKFNDNGWGCAYRSLQTLCSWYLYNGYTEKPVPSHTQIQQTLVDMGDKPGKFVNSRQWIGSVEVGYVLDSYLSMPHRIQFVNSGEDMGMQGGLLSFHFKTQGTPVMIGGGVLAHTILGVRYDDVTGDTQFLILDPHYTGKEDLDVILKEGWCGWKSCNFWDKKAHYNMCLPQRIAGV